MTTEPQAIDLVHQLDVALHGEAWARPYSPKEVWEDLLLEVRRLVLFRHQIHEVYEVYEATQKAGPPR